MTAERPAFPPIVLDDMDARLDRRAAARGIPTLQTPTMPQSDAATSTAAEPQPMDSTTGQGSSAARAPKVPLRRRVPRPVPIGARTVAPSPDAATPRSRMKSLNVELPDYVWVELKTRAARDMVSVRHVIMTLLQDAGIDIASADMIEDGRRLR